MGNGTYGVKTTAILLRSLTINQLDMILLIYIYIYQDSVTLGNDAV